MPAEIRCIGRSPTATAGTQPITNADDFEESLVPEAPPDELPALPRCAYEVPFDHWRVSRRVNNAGDDAADLLSPLNKQGAGARSLQDSRV